MNTQSAIGGFGYTGVAGKGLSPAIWDKYRAWSLLSGVPCHEGWGHCWDWNNGDIEIAAATYPLGWTGTSVSTGTILHANNSIMRLDSAAGAQGQGIQMQALKVPVLCAAGIVTLCEFRIGIGDTPITAQFFGGLAASDTTILATAWTAVTCADFIGIQHLPDASDAGIAQGVARSASGTIGKVSTGHTFVDGGTSSPFAAAAFVNFGFVVNGLTDITYFKNGVAVATKLLTASIPALVVYPSLVCQGNTTTDPICDNDWFAIAQAAAPGYSSGRSS